MYEGLEYSKEFDPLRYSKYVVTMYAKKVAVFHKSKNLVHAIHMMRKKGFIKLDVKSMRNDQTIVAAAEVIMNRKIRNDGKGEHLENLAAVLDTKKNAPIGRLAEFYRSSDWKRLRYKVFTASSGRCACCGHSAKDGAKMIVDHIKPLRFYWDLRLMESNLQILCDDCNLGKASDDQTDWRATEATTSYEDGYRDLDNVYDIRDALNGNG